MTTILIAEDDRILAGTLKDDLELEGYKVEVAGDGQTALQRALSAHFDLIVLDIMLPGLDGFEVCRHLRRARKTVPVIMLTARAQEADRIMGLELGADDYITKPFSARELRARVKAVLRRTSGDSAPVECFGDIELDFTRGEVRRAGAVVDLTPSEFRLLAAFVRRRGQVLSRQRLLDEAWDSGTFVTDRVIDTHILNLRKKIEPDPASPTFVVSVRGQGYRFDA